MPGRFKDYIANRKANGYQSIHTTVYGPKGPINSRSEPRKCTRLPNTGLRLTGPIKKGSRVRSTAKESAIGMNWIKEMMELQDQSGDAKEFVENVKKTSWQKRFTSSHQMEPCARFRKILGRSILPIEIPPRLGKKRLVLRSMAGWCPSIPNFGRETRWRLSPMPTPLVRAVTG